MGNALQGFDLRDPEQLRAFQAGAAIRVTSSSGDITDRPLLDLVTHPIDTMAFYAYGMKITPAAGVPIVYPLQVAWRVVLGTKKAVDYGAALLTVGVSNILSPQDLRTGLIFQVSGVLAERWIIHAELPAGVQGTVEFVLDAVFARSGIAGFAIQTGVVIG